jgi:hypothetical protein
MCAKQTTNKTYCSYECRNTGFVGIRDKTKIILCKICDKETTNKIYCSEKCQHIGAKVPKRVREQRICLYCQNTFLIRETKKNKLCSRKCSDLYKGKINRGKKRKAHTQEWKNEMSMFMKNKWKEFEYVSLVMETRKNILQTKEYPFGADPISLEKKKQSIKISSLEKYGTEHPFSATAYREECEKICLEKYGKKSYEMAQQKIDKEVIEKRRKTLIETILGISYEEYETKLPQKEKYYKRVKRISESQPLYLLENYDKRGKTGQQEAYHLDHIIPVSYGFIHNIPPEIIGDISNLQFIYWLENLRKGSKYEEKDQDNKETA